MADSITLKNKSGGCGGMIGGLFFGVIAFFASFVLLFWNEGRAVQTYNSLNEGAAAVVSVSADSVVAANNGKLVHVSGEAVTNDVVTDRDFGISLKAIKLKRDVQMYQWKETSKKNSNNTTTYTYEKIWADSLISSRNFQSGHDNPTEMRFKSADFVATTVTLGAYTLSHSLVDNITGGRSLAVDSVKYTLPASVQAQTKVTDGYFYIGRGSIASPEIGDMQIKYTVIEQPTTVSVISGQKDKTFVPYKTKAGDELNMLDMGAQSPEEMIQSAQDTNTFMTWLVRGGGFFVMYIGAALLLSPATTLLKFIPLLGELVERALLAVAFAITFLLSFVTISLAWLVYHPLIGVALLCVGVAVFGGVIGMVLVFMKIVKK